MIRKCIYPLQVYENNVFCVKSADFQFWSETLLIWLLMMRSDEGWL